MQPCLRLLSHGRHLLVHRDVGGLPDVVVPLHGLGPSIPLPAVLAFLAAQSSLELDHVVDLDGVLNLFVKGLPVGVSSLLGGCLRLGGIPLLDSSHGFLVVLVLGHIFEPFVPLLVEGVQGALILGICQALVVTFDLRIGLGRISDQLVQILLALLFDLVHHGGLIGSQLVGKHFDSIGRDSVLLELSNLLGSFADILGHAGHAGLVGGAGLLADGVPHGHKELERPVFCLLEPLEGLLLFALVGQHALGGGLVARKPGDGAVASYAKLFVPPG